MRVFYIMILMAVFFKSFAQTNSYPTSGNVKVFGAEEAWAEGILVVKPTNWGGLRLARTNPSGGNYNGIWGLGYNGSTGNDFSISNNYNGTQYDGIFHIGIATRNIGIGTTTPGSWFAGKTMEITDGRPILKLNSSASNGLSTILFTNANISATTHQGEFHLNYVSNQADATQSKLAFYGYPGGESLTIMANGNVGIGSALPNQKLTVNGTIYGKELKLDLNVPGPDYVFEKEYVLPSLESIQTYIDQNKHLPEVPSAKEMETNGINLSEMNMLLLKKVEELTLYIIEQDKKNNEQEKRLDEATRKIDKQQIQIELLIRK